MKNPVVLHGSRINIFSSIFILLVCFLMSAQVMAQNYQIILGPDQIALNQAFTITLEIKNERLQSYDGFPEIPGFEKRGTSNSSSMSVYNGRVSQTQSITQTYVANAKGVYTIRPFTMTANGTTIKSPGKKVTVTDPVQQQRQQFDPFSYDPFEDFFGKRQQPQEFIDIKEDAFFALTVDKDEVYVGEGFNTILAFYYAESNQAGLMEFYEPTSQVARIVKEITPGSCWEENFNIEKLTKEVVTINGKRYARYKIFQATYFPLNTDTISFPSVDLKMIKYKMAKNPTYFGRNKQRDFKTFHTKPQKVIVKPLPPHPLSKSVSVGEFKLNESVDSQALQTGTSFNYKFTITGEGNIASLTNPVVAPQKDFDFYPPNIQQSINRSRGAVRGAKTFNYYIIPNEPGEFNMGDLIKWVYFDPQRETYDTLKSNITLFVSGESKKNTHISSSDLGSFYDIIDIESNRLGKFDKSGYLKGLSTIIISLLLAITLFTLFKKR